MLTVVLGSGLELPWAVWGGTLPALPQKALPPLPIQARQGLPGAASAAALAVEVEVEVALPLATEAANLDSDNSK